ncbi:signal peptide peptidase SppA [Volucribacter amazonae]|uniref:Signal peptide peptidase SppA n=1 Tax=Volucribacter amazonae TaxID=256731 RepID=A0A9X4PF64_9PAST|nr:signal peptide peptidase SppA [Volucribacter amazonae]MDG6894070.1 signal peptide peptidase SppA [Volucribacter amazonae]
MQFIFSIIKFCWRTLNFIRDCVMNLIFLVFVLVFFSIIGIVSQFDKEPEPLIGEQGALVLNIEGYLADNREQESWQNLLKAANNQTVPRQYSVFDLFYAIQNAAEDERITGLVLDLSYFEGGDLPAISYLGEAINAFKQQDKPVIAVADYYGQSQYLLASYADKIYMNKAGQVDIHGFAMQNLYFKSLLDKLDVTPHVFRVGTYKSAVEPFLRDNMSAEARKNTTQWLTQMWQSYQHTVAENRHIDINEVLPEPQRFLAELTALNGDLTAYSVKRQLISQLITPFEFNQELIKLFGYGANDRYKHIDYDRYWQSLPDPFIANSEQKIAVVNVEGAIIDGESDESSVGGDTIARLLRQAREDSDIKGVILRVNSPGGSAFASEIIRQGVDDLQQAGKPVVVSMGAMAASGGYWIASTADYIVADPNTLTGSIGIFAMFPTFENSIKKIGIYGDEVAVSPFSQGSLITPLSNEVKDVIQLSIENGYDKFLSIVSKGRGLSKDEVDKVAQGQVWLGTDAYRYKLVDELGSFNQAVSKAVELVEKRQPNEKQPHLSLEWLVDEQGLFDKLFQDFDRQIKSSIGQAIFDLLGIKPDHYQQVKSQFGLSQFNDPKGQYLYCLNCNVSQ